MRTFREILEKSEIPELEVRDYDLSDEAREKGIPWIFDQQAKNDIRLRSIRAKKFWQENYNNTEVVTADGHKIYFTKKGREEFFSSIKTAFFLEDSPKRAASDRIKQNLQLTNGLIQAIYVLEDLVKKSSLEHEEANHKKFKKEVDHYETFLVPIKLNGKEKKMKIKVQFVNKGDGINKRIYYYHWLQEHKIPIIPIIAEFSFLD
ncbi:MAG: hypothetical protein LBD41_07995 [Clostridiales Family XIII bacterium]|jgi:hypothetical protein|nr:hypothetical protein [Clostridiales Family XIII bacterium]